MLWVCERECVSVLWASPQLLPGTSGKSLAFFPDTMSKALKVSLKKHDGVSLKSSGLVRQWTCINKT